MSDHLQTSIMDESDLSDKEREAILELQSSDAESTSDDDITTLGNKSHPDSSSDRAAVSNAVANILNWIEGSGFLALPFAVKEGGIAVIVSFVIIAFCLWYTGKVLIECLYGTDEKQRRVRVRSTFKELGEILLPRYGSYLVTAFVQMDIFVISVSYLILCGSLMSHSLPSVPLTAVAWTCIAGVVVFPATFLKALSEIGWLSAVSVVAMTSVVISVLWYGAEHVDEWNLDTILFWDSEGVSIALPMLIYSYGAVPILPSVEKSMREKQKFSRVLALAYAIAMLMKILFSLFAFLSFKANTAQVVLNNLPAGPFRMSISFIFVLSCILSTVLPMYPTIDLLEKSEKIENAFSRIPMLGSFVIRITVVMSAVLVAILFPKFALVVSFTGSVATIFITYIFPCAVHLKLKFKQLKTYEVFLDVLIIFFGTVVIIFGVTFSGKALVQS